MFVVSLTKSMESLAAGGREEVRLIMTGGDVQKYEILCLVLIGS